MTRSPRRSTAAAPLLCAVAFAAAGCAAPGGLAPGESVAPVSPQPQPEPLWPAWTDASPRAAGAATGTRQPPPEPLRDAPEVGPGGLRAVDATAVAKADKRMKLFLGKGVLNAPGGAGLRPAVYADLTGNGQKELVVAADTESGRTALSVYAAEGKRIVPVLFTVGRRMQAESIGQDLLVRTAPDDGSEQVVRYHWDGTRMTVVSDERRYTAPLPRADGQSTP
ncbi:hypothetical protein EF910_20465 [Streptomyces sp. WAC07149]|uniref:hypothetical protein n=1 Tax=Streptomyces sp. WAC07149 TaxID=2487425 RepID=UPI000F7AD09F|nr:hypothetical protein [Streptomyces sp. WAC07149]RST03331.1 hypothetical protein EF910_20465 [Streptomyces sp. WAC07149]